MTRRKKTQNLKRMTKNKIEEKTTRKRKHALWVAAGSLALAFVFVLTVFFVSTKKGPEMIPDEPAVSIPESLGRHPLTGVPIYDVTALPQVFGVMIDNHVDAWPQSGLDKAFLIFEAPVEAGISRMLAFFYEGQAVEKIGPIRSARPYFIDWNNELDGMYTHVGGSDAALDKIESGGTTDLNEYWNDKSFWRSHDRYAPHNVYTSTELLETYLTKKREQGSLVAPLYEAWLFKDSIVDSKKEVQNIQLSFYPPSSVVDWTYDSSLNIYHRFQGGVAHVMKNGVQLMANNVAVMITDVKILDAVGRRRVKTIGEGEAMVFQDGQQMEARWKKVSENQRVRFYRLDDSEIVFNEGSTWIEVIGDMSDVSWN